MGTLGWTGMLSGAHAYLNVQWPTVLNRYLPEDQRKFNVAYIPVTCHLACPVTDYISKFSEAGQIFIPTMFQGFPEIKEALIANQMQAAFIVAPLAVALRSQGVPIKIVYLGHRYGSAVVVHKDGGVKTFPDLRGKTVATPGRFSDERLLLFKAMKVFGIDPSEIKLVEMAPPDVASALAARAIDGFSMGEPFPSQAEMGGFGRVLFHAREYWPDYMSCVLVVQEDLINRRPDAVQILVDGVARSGLWLDEGQRNREAPGAAAVGAHQPPHPRDVLAAVAPQARLRHGRGPDGGNRRTREAHRVRGIHRAPLRGVVADPDRLEIRARQRLGPLGRQEWHARQFRTCHFATRLESYVHG